MTDEILASVCAATPRRGSLLYKKPCIAALAAAILPAVLFTALDASAGEPRLVRSHGYAASDGWKVKKVLDRDLYWIVPRGGNEWTKDWNFPEMAMTRHLWCLLYGWFGINDLVVGANLKNPEFKYANWTPTDRSKWKIYSAWTNSPARFTDLLEKTMGGEAYVRRFLERYPNHPLYGWCPDLRPIRWLKPDFDTDRENYRRWKAAHPSFLGFMGLSEFEGEFGKHSDDILKDSGAEIYERVNRHFPYSDDLRTQLNYTSKACDHISNFYFGEKNISAVASIAPPTLFAAARTGRLFYMQYEAELGSTSGPYSLGGIYTRGCSRQFDIPFGWYLATYMHFCYTRDGRNTPGDLEWPYGKTGTWTSRFTPYRGAPRSLLNRAAFYGLMIGATSLQMEKWTCFFYETETPDSPVRPSRYMRDLDSIFEINSKIDRGAPYTPVAVLSSMEELYNRSAFTPNFRDKWSLAALFNTLVPMHVDNYESRHHAGNRKKGDVGCMWNSEFGEFMDALCPDADQESAKFLKALSDYKAAILVGWFNKDHFDAKAVKSYARNGGTLFVDSDKLDQGLVTAEMAGVSFSAEKSPAADEVFSADGKAPAFKFGESYSVRKAKPTTAKPLLVDANGTVVAWANDFGKGRVVTVAVDRMLPDALVRCPYNDGIFSITSCKRTFPLIAYLLRRIQDETLPVKVDGDIQWGVNKTKTGWLVWLINNKGVVKFSGEPEELDPKAASTVKVTDKATGKVYEKTIPPGGYGWITL